MERKSPNIHFFENLCWKDVIIDHDQCCDANRESDKAIEHDYDQLETLFANVENTDA